MASTGIRDEMKNTLFDDILTALTLAASIILPLVFFYL
jgi:hypothetical protein